MKENWDDLRFVLAVADYGSVSAASKVLGVNHATVLRRVAAFEDRHGAQIFEKAQTGYVVAQGQSATIEAAREVYTAMLSVGRVIQGSQEPLSGVVHVTSTDSLCTTVMPRAISALRGVAKELHVELISANAHLDFARMAADVTVRPSLTLPDDMTGDVVAHLPFAVYAMPHAPDAWLRLSGNLQRSKPAEWMQGEVSEDQIVASADSFLTLAQMVKSGLGRSFLPCLVGDLHPEFARLPIAPDMNAKLWVACHKDMQDVPRIRAVRDEISKYLTAAL